ncbi:MAG: Uma2 family endonuclease [Pseudanabaena sp. M57BS1SP1A06MG]|jgi:Uma2 family endonuclease|nr:Uma2 family endonuclease [Pseudanabaena sp. M53BS1SP1A06MG]MCA6583000.1 Uma2 family endonuclease [Pseudanabaena sp. M34BS1SP1A06MG]MCA6594170.1 Uma2 family endonuclease [Pseudanabaena sp. M38BS1SP1A06MG]MCA6598922.1 Uma2 family endonuclease [Pseudanabaena sp. M57BS1SP1A06MG]
MIANLKNNFLTPEEYLAWEAEQQVRHEYIDGVVYAMAGGTIAHNDIALNVYNALRSHLKAMGCRINVADVKVQDRNASKYFYPDVVVSCNESDRQSREVIAFPKLIIEVLSPSTEAFDRGDKFKYYRRFPSLLEYVLIDAEKINIDVYRRGDTGKWELTNYPEDFEGTDHADLFELTSINFQCSLGLIYEDVELLLVSETYQD